jgi:predicted transcriptional regulator
LHAASHIRATEAAAFAVERAASELRLLHHIRPDDSEVSQRAAAAEAFAEIAARCVASGKNGIIEIVKTRRFRAAQYCLVTLARHQQTVIGAAAFIVRGRTIPDLQRRLSVLDQLTLASAFGAP